MGNVKDKIETLKKKKEALNNRIQKMEGMEKSRNRKRDTRRKILVGAYFLDKYTNDGKTEELKNIMIEFLTRESDKVLFGDQKQK